MGIHEKCDLNHDGKFSFEEMVGVISGRANLTDAVDGPTSETPHKDEFADRVLERTTGDEKKGEAAAGDEKKGDGAAPPADEKKGDGEAPPADEKKGDGAAPPAD